MIRPVSKGIKCSINMLDGGRTPLVTFKELEDMGFARVSVPVLTTYAAAKGLYDTLSQLKRDGTNKNLQDKIFPFADFNKLIGLPSIRDMEARFLPQETIANKYGSIEELEKEKRLGH